MHLSRMMILLVAIWATTMAAPSVGADGGSQASGTTVTRIALLPLGNYTHTDEYSVRAVEQLTLAFNRSQVEVIASEMLRPVLREFRIRSRGSVARVDLEKLSTRIDCDYFVVGSIDLIREGEIPELSMSLRALRADRSEVMAAVSVSATGRDYTGLFGIGTVEDMDTLIAKVSGEAVHALLEQSELATADLNRRPGRWVVIAFDNGSTDRMAGQVVSNWLVSRMVSAGYVVIEPGTVDRLFRRLGGKAVGGIDRPRASILKDSLDVGQLLTGEIDQFATGSGLTEASEPKLALGIRLVDIQSGLVETVYEVESRGNQYETLFGAGRCHALGALAERSIDGVLDRLKKDMPRFGAK